MIIIIEIIFNIYYKTINEENFLVIILIIISYIFIGIQDNIEKYLLEVNSINSFICLC